MTPHQYPPHGLTGSKRDMTLPVYKASESGRVDTEVVRHCRGQLK